MQKKTLLGWLPFFISFYQLTYAGFCPDESEYRYLDELALKNDPYGYLGKGSNWHNYTEVYAQYFASLRHKPVKFLEIGIFEGSSVKMWEEYFDNAELHFIDINFSQIKYFSNRSHYHLADQANTADLLKVMSVTKGDFDIIVDDGGHTMWQQLVSFKTLFPYLKSGGMYIIEDLHTSYWKAYGGGGSLEHPVSGPGTFVNFLKDLIDEVNFVGARTGMAGHHNIPLSIQSELTDYRNQIYTMHFYDSLCVIIKR